MSRWIAALAVATLLSLPMTASATPGSLAVTGTLTAGAGTGAAADGDYILTMRLYPAAQGGTALWEEAPQVVTVLGGRFGLTIGTKTPITPGLLASAAQAWLGVQVGNEPELPRVALHAVAFAVQAAAAESVQCSGCIGVAQLDPKFVATLLKSTDVDKLDLSGYAKKAELAKIAQSGHWNDLQGAPKLADVATSGVYADLVGAPVVPKVGTLCGTGLVVRGFKVDGSLECVAGGVDTAALPPHGLSAISNGLLTNVFTEIASLDKPIDIPDANLKGATATVKVPDVGKALALQVSVDLTTSSLGQLTVTLTAPGGASYLLVNKSGTGTALKATYPKPDSTLSGDLTAWVGKNPVGDWTLTAVDSQIGAQTTDGQIKGFSVQVETLSNKKVAATGGLLLPSANQVTEPCAAGNKGLSIVVPSLGGLAVCDGKNWQLLKFMQTCGNGLLNPGEQCDDGNDAPADGCYLCKTAFCGDGMVNNGEACDDGPKNSDTVADACRTTCVKPACGDKVKDATEECDDGNSFFNDGCTPFCVSEVKVNVTFKTCGATGQSGPNASQCQTAYAGTPLAGFVAVNGGIQSWTVPTDGTYRIEAWGARAALNGPSAAGNNGARMRGDFVLKKGTVLKILVGQMGTKSPSATSSSGGGGTFVVQSDNTPLLIAGGGGGRGGNGSQPGVGGSTANCGTKDDRGFGTPGCNGQGGISGTVSNVNGGGGGAGLTGNGLAKQSNSGNPGISFVNGGTGGASRDGQSWGGFGGGGGNHESAGGGGGGGGYGGGSGGQYEGGTYGGGGGGGSYNSGANPSSGAGEWASDGQVTIVKQ